VTPLTTIQQCCSGQGSALLASGIPVTIKCTNIMLEPLMIYFEWDDKKADANWRKHGVRFEEAKFALSDPYRWTEEDLTESDEERWQTIGMSSDCRLLFVVYTIQGNGTEI
jgi:uncharacterized DUF497 family protein